LEGIGVGEKGQLCLNYGRVEAESGGGDGSGGKGQLGRVIAKTVTEREAVKRNHHNHVSLSFLCDCE